MKSSHLKVPPRPEVQKRREKFPETYQLVEMLKYFQESHNNTCQNLIDSGEGHRVRLFESISVEKLKKYIYEQEEMEL